MRLKFFDAENQREAAFLAAGALGPSAILVEGAGGGADRPFASLVGEGAGPRDIDVAEHVETVLHYHGAPRELVQRALEGRKPQADPRRLLATGLRAALSFARLPRADRVRLMLIGPPAAGKTTLMGKLAARGSTPTATVFSTDWARPGGLEQLADSMSILGIDTARLDPDAPVPGAGRPGPLLIDTAGTDAGDEAGLAKLGRLAALLAVEPVLVLPALIDGDEATSFARAAMAIGVRKLLVTRLDMAKRLGGPLAAAHAGMALAGASVTPNFAYGLKSMSAATLANHLIELAERP
ncbi:MAG TPA: hypothetical protein VM689_07305 [Aliidongia sp.]|nr:hypothetical protein [Aliidongia sp.]